MITANSFMKREFGKKLIEEYIPRWDLTHVIDTSGAYIPGHGTPTVILFGRHRRPVSDDCSSGARHPRRTETPEDPSRGLVWSAILDQVDKPGSAERVRQRCGHGQRRSFHSHPWSIGGGGAAELKELLETRRQRRLERLVESISAFDASRAKMTSFCSTRHRHARQLRCS